MADQDRSRFVRAIESAPFAAMLGLKIESAANGASLIGLNQCGAPMA